MELKSFPRRNYISEVTPIEPMEKLSKHLGGPNLYIKRDDLMKGLTEGGNKIRKLEFVVADALQQGADTLITCGAVQSNHCRLTLAAAVKEGLNCRLVIEERVPGSYDKAATGNNLLFHILGVEKITVIPGNSDAAAEMEKEKNELASSGRKGYIIPGGASYEIGALGYVSCAEEILNQASSMGLSFDYLVTPTGSGGTYTGLLAGFFKNNADIPVLGINVSRDRKAQEELVLNLAQRVLKKLEIDRQLPAGNVRCFDQYVGPGYSLSTDQMKSAVKLLGRLEGILCDPIYSGKGMAGLIDLAKQGYFQPGENVLFLHTGGVPALYAYADIFLTEDSKLD